MHSVRRGQPRGVLALGRVVVEGVALAFVAGPLLPLNALARFDLPIHTNVVPRVVVARSAAARRARAARLGAGRPHFPLAPTIIP